MNKLKGHINTLLCALVILLSVFANTGFYAHAQEVDYLNESETIVIKKDSGSSDYSIIDSTHTVTGASGVIYKNGLRVLLTRDSDDGSSLVALTFDAKSGTEKLSGYIDLDETSENDGSFSVRLEVLADGAVAYTVTMTENTRFPLTLNASVSGAEKVTLRFADTAPNEGETAFIIGNAALCKNGGNVPAVTVPDNNESNDDNNNDDSEDNETDEPEETEPASTTDLSADARELLSKATEYLGHKYLYVTMQISWEQAAAWCEMQGGYLVTVGSESENRFLSDYLRSLGNKTAYTGMSGGESGGFKWQNGETAAYMNWARHSEDISGTVYMKMGNGTDKWTYGKANEEYLSFIIEWGDKAALDESENADSAIIIIPGLGGCDLSCSDTDSTWAKKSGMYNELSIDRIPTESEVTTAGGEYGTDEVYKALMEGIGEVCSHSDVVLYNWDWRGSASEGAAGLGAFIEYGGWSNVSLVCHNTGGLVACYYIVENGTNGIDCLITLGTPFYGSEAAFCMLHTGMFARGAGSVRGRLSENVSTLKALSALVPEQPQVGTAGFTGRLTSRLSRQEALSAVGSDVSAPADSTSLREVYGLLENGSLGCAYIIAGIGEPTVNSAEYSEGKIRRIHADLDGDGLTDAYSAAMGYRSARPPYILENTNALELVTNADSIRLVCNILSGNGDTSDYAAGVEKSVHRSVRNTSETPVEISVSGNARLSVQCGDETTVLFDDAYSFSGSSQNAFICGDIKTVFADKDAQITLEILGDNVCLAISGDGFCRTWTNIEPGAGSTLKGTVTSEVLTVAVDGSNSGLTELAADAVPTSLSFAPPSSDATDATEDIEGRLVLPWNIWVAAGLLLAAAAVAFILMPYFAYRASKVETDRKKRALRQAIRQRRRQTARQRPYAQPGSPISGEPAALPPSGSDVSFDINDVLGEDSSVDFDFLSRS